jgi:hypothetical protein
MIMGSVIHIPSRLFAEAVSNPDGISFEEKNSKGCLKLVTVSETLESLPCHIIVFDGM